METRQAILTRHKKESKDLIGEITALKKTATKGDKQKKKEVTTEIALREEALKDRHAEELAAVEAVTVSDDAAVNVALNGHVDLPIDPELSAVAGLASLDVGDNDSGSKLSSQVGGSHQQSDARPSASSGTVKPNRQKARLAKRAAAMEEQRAEAAIEAASLPDLKAQEDQKLQQTLSKRRLAEKQIKPDGHCLYAAFADQLSSYGHKTDYAALRKDAAGYIRTHQDDFLPFIIADEHSGAESVDAYADEIEKTAIWGGELEILALARKWDTGVEVWSASDVPIRINMDGSEDKVVRLAYHKHMFGLGSHYNSCIEQAGVA